jgi:UDP-GlcNAc:undecaprenyl-phosphate GlcNAc-1-phosphate transferase
LKRILGIRVTRGLLKSAAFLAAGTALLGFGVALAPGIGVLFVGAFVFTWWLVPYAARIARRLRAVARPGGRANHARTVPRLGGAAIVLPLAGALAAGALDGDMASLGMLGGLLLTFALGAADDVRGVSPRTKLLVQALAAGCLLAGGVRLEALSIPGLGTLDLGVLGVPLLVFWVIAATNAFNLIDGMDGLAPSIACLAAMGCLFAGAPTGASLVLAGASLGFLRYNFPPARIFLGDSGSMPIGFLLGALALQVRPEQNVPLVVGILAYPLADLSLAVLRRFVRGKPLFEADRGHLHHRVLQFVGEVRLALATIVLFAGALLALALLRPGVASVAITLGVLAVVGIGLVWRASQNGGRVFAYRRPLQHLYVVKRYAMDCLKLAECRDDVVKALRAMADALEISDVRLRNVILGNGLVPEGYAVHSVPLRGDRATWAAFPIDDALVEEERKTVVTDVLRTADKVLRDLDDDSDALPFPDPSPPAAATRPEPTVRVVR